jgi:hypothetical protein
VTKSVDVHWSVSKGDEGLLRETTAAALPRRRRRATEVADLRDLTDARRTSRRHIIAIDVFRRARRRLSSAEPSATRPAPSATRRWWSAAPRPGGFVRNAATERIRVHA